MFNYSSFVAGLVLLFSASAISADIVIECNSCDMNEKHFVAKNAARLALSPNEHTSTKAHGSLQGWN